MLIILKKTVIFKKKYVIVNCKLHFFFRNNYVFSLHQLIPLIILYIKVLRWGNRKMNILQDILRCM